MPASVAARDRSTESHPSSQAQISPDSATYNPLALRPKIFWSIPMKPVILCVDDTPSVLEGEKMLLEENGYRVLTATNGKEAYFLVGGEFPIPVLQGGCNSGAVTIQFRQIRLAKNW